jgi:hypothetical protein
MRSHVISTGHLSCRTLERVCQPPAAQHSRFSYNAVLAYDAHPIGHVIVQHAHNRIFHIQLHGQLSVATIAQQKLPHASELTHPRPLRQPIATNGR